MKSKTASVRLPKDMYEEIDELCDGIGCSRNDWIKDTLKDRLREENSETKEPETKEDPKTAKGEIISDDKPTIGTIRTTKDGKYRLKNIQNNGAQIWEEVEEPKEMQNARIVLESEPKQIDNSNKPPIEMVLFNGKYIPKAEVYEV